MAEHIWKLFFELPLHYFDVYSSDKLHTQLCISKDSTFAIAQECSLINVTANKCHNISELLTSREQEKMFPPPPFLVLCLLQSALPPHLLLPHLYANP